MKVSFALALRSIVMSASLVIIHISVIAGHLLQVCTLPVFTRTPIKHNFKRSLITLIWTNMFLNISNLELYWLKRQRKIYWININELPLVWWLSVLRCLATYCSWFISWVFHIIFSFVHIILFDTFGGLCTFRKPFNI